MMLRGIFKLGTSPLKTQGNTDFYWGVALTRIVIISLNLGIFGDINDHFLINFR